MHYKYFSSGYKNGLNVFSSNTGIKLWSSNNRKQVCTSISLQSVFSSINYIIMVQLFK